MKTLRTAILFGLSIGLFNSAYANSFQARGDEGVQAVTPGRNLQSALDFPPGPYLQPENPQGVIIQDRRGNAIPRSLQPVNSNTIMVSGIIVQDRRGK